MSNLREKLENWYNSEPKNKEDEILVLEQITDDFSVKLIIWMVNIKPNDENLKHIDFTKSDEYVAKQLQQYFKDNVYGR